MDIDTKLAVLDQIYRIYDDFASTLKVACKKYCDQCCTPKVTLTTLEGYLVAEYIIAGEKLNLFENVKKALAKKRFQPQTTINKIADLCIKGKDFPQEKNDYVKGSCPLLKDHQCPVYLVRPFGCRCFFSKHDCREKGNADIDSFVLTVNNAFLQFIEHVDFQGFSGNLTDVLMLMASRKNRHNYKMNKLKNPAPGLITNLPIKVLMIPPEHRIKIKPILNTLQNIKVPTAINGL